jgi:nitroreductase
MYSSEFSAIVNKRRSVRKFDPLIEVPEAVVKKCLELAILSPNSSNMQLWEFYWMKSAESRAPFEKYCLGQSAAKSAKHLVVFVTRKDLWKKHAAWNYDHIKAAIGDKEISKREKNALSYYGKLMPLIYRADIFGVSTLVRKLICFFMGFRKPFMRMGGEADQRVMVHKSCALAAQTFMLAIAAEGLDSCPMEGFDALRVKKTLGLPKGAEVSMIVAVGKGLADGIYGERMRLPFDEVVFVK